jgi:hypothetical protein
MQSAELKLCPMQTHGEWQQRSFHSAALCILHSTLYGPGSHTLYAIGFRFYFTPLAGVLFTVPSRYLFTIGCQRVFSLIQWSGQIHAEFHVHRITWDTLRGFRTSLTRLSRSVADFSTSLSSSFLSQIRVPQPRSDKSERFRLFRFRSPLLTESQSFSFPGVTEMFHFAPFRPAGL